MAVAMHAITGTKEAQKKIDPKLFIMVQRCRTDYISANANILQEYFIFL